MLRHLRCWVRYGPESIQRVVAQVAFYTFVQTRNGNLNVPYLYEDDGKVVAEVAHPPLLPLTFLSTTEQKAEHILGATLKVATLILLK